MLYDILRLLLSNFLQILFRCEVSGLAHIPERSGVIIAANHVSNWDPPVAAAFVPRHVHYMAKQELFEVPVLGGIIRKLHAFPVKRGASDRGAIKNAIRLLQEGGCLGLFPEGTRNKATGLKKPEAGIALIAAKSGACVVPAALIGTNKMFSSRCFLPKIKIAYGKPIFFDSQQQEQEMLTEKERLQRFSQRIMDEIQVLLDANEQSKHES